jgi:hypothetical protein
MLYAPTAHIRLGSRLLPFALLGSALSASAVRVAANIDPATAFRRPEESFYQAASVLR